MTEYTKKVPNIIILKENANLSHNKMPLQLYTNTRLGISYTSI